MRITISKLISKSEVTYCPAGIHTILVELLRGYVNMENGAFDLSVVIFFTIEGTNFLDLTT